MADNNYNIILGGIIDESTLKKNILELDNKFTLKIKLDFGDIDAKLQEVSDKINRRVQETSPKLATPTVDGSILPSGVETGTVSTLNKKNELIKQTISLVGKENEVIKRTFVSHKDGTLQLQKQTIATKTNYELNKKNAQSYQDITSRIKNLTEASNLSKKNATALNAELARIQQLAPDKQQQAFKALSQSISDNRKQARGFGADLKTAFEKMGVWLIAGNIFFNILRAIKGVVVQVREMDKALVELSKVSDLTKSGLKDVTTQAFSLGKEVGRTGTEVLSAVTEFKRAGYELQDSFNLAKVALTLTNVAEGITDAGTASTYLIGILKGANIEISKAGYLLDQLNEISNTQAIGFDNLAEMTQRIAGTMHIFGNSIEETMGLITAAFEVLQDERVARGLSTIASRIAGMNENLEEEEGLASSVAKALDDYADIDVMDMNGQLKSTFEILKELSAKWSGITKNAQGFLMTELAGKNRSDVFASIMTNFGAVESSISSATDAFGSAEQEQAKYLNSIEGRIAGLKESLQEFSLESLNSGFVKFLISTLNGIVKISTAVGGLLTVLTTVGAAVLGIMGTIKLVKALKVVKSLNAVATATAGVELAVARTARSMAILQLSMSAILAVFSIVFGVIQAVGAADKKRMETNEEVAQSTLNRANALKELKQEYIDLSTITDKTDTQKERLVAISKELARTYGIEASAIDLLNGKYAENTAAIREKEKATAKEVASTAQAVIADLEKQLKKTIRSSAYMAGAPSNPFTGTATEVFDKYVRLQSELLKKQQTTKLDKQEQFNLDYYNKQIVEQKDLIDKLKEQQTILSEAQSAISFLEDKTAGAELDEQARIMSEFLKKPLREQADELAKTEKAFSDYIEGLKGKGLYEGNETAIDKITEAFREQAKVIRETDFAMLALDDTMESLKKQLKTEKELAKKEADRLKIAEKQLAVDKQRAEFEKAKDKKMLIYRQGKGFVYETDFSAINLAQDNLDKAVADLEKTKEEIEGTEIEKALKDTEKLMAIYNQAMLDGVKIEEKTIREYFAIAENLAAFEKATYQERLDSLKKFLSEKNKLEADKENPDFVTDKPTPAPPPTTTPTPPSPPPTNPSTWWHGDGNNWGNSAESLNIGGYMKKHKGASKDDILGIQQQLAQHNFAGINDKKIANAQAFLTSDYATYHDGGVVGSKSKSNNVGAMSLKTNEEFAKLLKPEYVATLQMQKNAVKNFGIASQKSGDTFVTNVGTIALPNVGDSQQFINEMRIIALKASQTVTTRK